MCFKVFIEYFVNAHVRVLNAPILMAYFLGLNHMLGYLCVESKYLT